MGTATLETVGRETELAELRAVLATGGPAAIVLEGAPGIGKTALWLASIELAEAEGYRALSARPTESEARLAFAGLRDLFGDLFEEVELALPAPQARALAVSLLLEEPGGPPPEPAAVATAVVNAVRAAATEAPLLIAVDDVQWLDRPTARVLEFVARRLRDVRVVIVVAHRIEPGAFVPLGLDRALPAERLRRVPIGGLSVGALQRALAARLGVPVAGWVVRRVHAAAEGNPFLSFELAPELLALDGPLAPDAPLPVPASLRELLRRRIHRLPRRTRRALVAAAALSQPTVDVVAGVEGIEPSDLEPAQAERVIDVDGDRMEFRHPLLASVAYEEVPARARRDLHRELAAKIADPEEAARHVALAAEGDDPAAARQLADAAQLARSRGAPGAAADLLEAAVRLTPPDDASLQRRKLEAAAFRLEAGELERARFLVAEAGQRATAAERSEALWLQAAIAYETESLGEVRNAFGEALSSAGGNDPLATRVRLALAWVCHLDCALGEAEEHAAAAVALAARIGDPGLMAHSFAMSAHMHFIRGRGIRHDLLDRALELEQAGAVGEVDSRTIHALELMVIGELAPARAHFSALANERRAAGITSSLSEALIYLSLAESRGGHLREGRAAADEAVELLFLADQVVNQPAALAARSLAEALLGERDEARRDAADGLRLAEETGQRAMAAFAHWALSLVDLPDGRSAAAFEEAAAAARLADELGYGDPGLVPVLPDAIDAAVAVGDLETAAAWADQLAGASTNPWALACAARGLGVLASARGDVDDAIASLERAVAAAEELELPLDQARALLALGIAQRRAKRRREARESLDSAADMFEASGARPWAELARRERGRISGRQPFGSSLTPTEERIAGLVAEGKRNREVAAELFVTEHTVEAALTRIYGKLAVRSRTELARRLAQKP